MTLDVDDYGAERRIVFTGDLGRRHMPILKDPEIPGGANLLISESTYGGREHPDIEEMDERLAEVVDETMNRGGKVVIPSFALERAQELIYALKRIRRAGKLPDVPIHGNPTDHTEFGSDAVWCQTPVSPFIDEGAGFTGPNRTRKRGVNVINVPSIP